jgi:outer membrane lipoprotein-sorting protein
VETKLPVAFKQWSNLTRQGSPAVELEGIVFLETVPDERFEFKIPEGTEVIETVPDPGKPEM